MVETSSVRVSKAQKHLENPTEDNWANVGLKVVDGNTLQIEYNEPIDTFTFKYGFAGAILPALNHMYMNKLVKIMVRLQQPLHPVAFII